MAYHLPTHVDGPATPLDRARELDELRHDRRPLVALVAGLAAFVVLSVALAVFGVGVRPPVDARSTGATTAEPVPALVPVDMRPAEVVVPTPRVVTPLRR